MMSITVQWLEKNEGTLYSYFPNTWDWPEFRRANDDIRQMLAYHTEPVYHLMDFSECHLLPSGCLTQMRNALITRPPCVELVVVVEGNMFVTSLMSILLRVYPKLRGLLVIANDMVEVQHLIQTHKKSTT